MNRIRFSTSLFAVSLVVAPVSAVPIKKALDPDATAGPSQCVECHESEVNAWRHTHHAASFGVGDFAESLEDVVFGKEDKAYDFSEAMGIEAYDDLGSTCATCHLSAYRDPTGEASMLGVSCESCHGPAGEWMPIHYDFGKSADGEPLTADSESAAHRKERIASAVAAGMLRPENVHRVAANCFGCHTVPNEKLVNVAGHPAGSDFELVSWSQGEVRHSYLDGDANRAASAERKRELYVVGRALDLQYSLAAAAEATKAGAYLDAMSERVANARKHVAEIQAAWANEHLAAMLSAVDGLEVKPGSDAVASARDAVASQAEALAGALAGADLAKVDPLIPSKTKGTAQK